MELKSQLTMLLTCDFKIRGNSSTKPLTLAEWEKLLMRLEKNRLKLEDLSNEMSTIVDHDTITEERILKLLDRGVAMGMALEKWTRYGLWVLTRYDKQYPESLIEKLKNGESPKKSPRKSKKGSMIWGKTKSLLKMSNILGKRR